MLISVKPCLNCGNDQVSGYKEYNGLLGYEAIICKKCGFIYDHNGAHEPDTDVNSAMYVVVDHEALKRQKRLEQMAPQLLTAIKDALSTLNEIPNKRLTGKFKDSYSVCLYLGKVIAKAEVKA